MLFFNLPPQFKSTIKTIFTAQRDSIYAVIFVFLVHTALIAAIFLGQNQTPSKNILVQSPVMIFNFTVPKIPEKSAQPSVAKTRPVIPPKTVTPPKKVALPKAVTPAKPVDVPKPMHTPPQPATVVQAVAIPDIKKSSDILPVAIQQTEVTSNLPTTNNAVSNAVVPSNTPSNTPSNSSSSTYSDISSNNEVSRNVETSVKTPVIFNADYLNNPTPAYPNISRLRGETGKVLLRISVNRNGQAASIELHRSSGSSKLDEAAIRTVRLWNFVPAKVDGNPVDSTVIVPIDFKLD
ncbi:MAG: hypothetical protein RL344_897 [Pseudomonadota bacterium]|jgi:protein TonB